MKNRSRQYKGLNDIDECNQTSSQDEEWKKKEYKSEGDFGECERYEAERNELSNEKETNSGSESPPLEPRVTKSNKSFIEFTISQQDAHNVKFGALWKEVSYH